MAFLLRKLSYFPDIDRENTEVCYNAGNSFKNDKSTLMVGSAHISIIIKSVLNKSNSNKSYIL